jgi:hypothetical protein
MGSDTGVASALMQIDVWGETYASVAATARQVRLALQRWRDASTSPAILDSFIQRDSARPGH